MNRVIFDEVGGRLGPAKQLVHVDLHIQVCGSCVGAEQRAVGIGGGGERRTTSTSGMSNA